MNWEKLSNRMLVTTLKTFSVKSHAIIYMRDGVSVGLPNAVFDKNFVTVDPGTGAHVTSTNPMLGVALADLPGGKSQNGDFVSVTEDGVPTVYKVVDGNQDSEGHTKLILQKP